MTGSCPVRPICPWDGVRARDESAARAVGKMLVVRILCFSFLTLPAEVFKWPMSLIHHQKYVVHVKGVLHLDGRCMSYKWWCMQILQGMPIRYRERDSFVKLQEHIGGVFSYFL